MLGAGGAGTIEKTPLPPLLKWAASQQQAGLGIGHVARGRHSGQDAARGRHLSKELPASQRLEQRKLASRAFPTFYWGGCSVLCVSLCVFGPLIELLDFLANVRNGRPTDEKFSYEAMQRNR